jgi:hypothetical protein
MSHIKQFLSAVGQAAPRNGKVVAVSNTTMSLATKLGVLVVPRDQISAYNVGDTVKVVNGVVVGKVRDVSSLPVYEV